MTEYEKFVRERLDRLVGTNSLSRAEIEALIVRLYDVHSWPRPRRIFWAGSPVGVALVREAYCQAYQTSSFGILASIRTPLNQAMGAKATPLNAGRINRKIYDSVQDAVRRTLTSPIVERHRSIYVALDGSEIGGGVQTREGEREHAPSEWMNIDDLVSESYRKSYLDEIQYLLPRFEGSLATCAMQIGLSVWEQAIQGYATDAITADWGWRFQDMPMQARLLTDLIFATELCTPHNDIVFVSERKLVAHFNDKGDLHKDGAPCLAYPDGMRYWYLNGIRVTKAIAETPAGELDARLVLTEKNVDIRREIIRKIGVERTMKNIGAKTVDKKGDYELVLIDFGDGVGRPYLRMANPSVPGVFHVEGVSPECDTVERALAWRNSLDKWVAPEVLT